MTLNLAYRSSERTLFERMKIILYHGMNKSEIYSFDDKYDAHTISMIMHRSIQRFNDMRLVDNICVREAVTQEDISKEDSITVFFDEFKPSFFSGYEPE